MSAGRKHLILAMDLVDRDQIIDMAVTLRDDIAMVKIGLEPFIAHGTDLVRALNDRGLAVFLDLKVHDIPRTAAAAARQASRLGARLFTVHAAGGSEMIQAAREAAGPRTKIIAVTMLTSLDDAAAGRIGFRDDVAGTVARLGELSLEAGADGLVCSAHELAALRDLGGLRVVPGIRPPKSDVGDQKRVATPAGAVSAGATWIVVGRPILNAADPVRTARAIGDSLAP